jgi:hypothetical protein
MFKNADLQIPIEVCVFKHSSTLGDTFNLMELSRYALSTTTLCPKFGSIQLKISNIRRLDNASSTTLKLGMKQGIAGGSN